jgi:hypothetical protein
MLGMTLKVMREEGGVFGLYRGLTATAMGVAPYVGINFATYEALRGIITPPGKSSVTRKLICGALAGEDRLADVTIPVLIFILYRINLADTNIPFRRAEAKDASRGHDIWRDGI